MFRVIHNKFSCVITYLLGVDNTKNAVVVHGVKSISEGVCLFRREHPSEKIISVVLQKSTRLFKLFRR